MSFAEEAVGTNAILLSMRLNGPVYTIPVHHYCDFLKDFYIYSIPLNANGSVLGYLAICRLKEPLRIELKILTEWTAYRIINEYKATENRNVSTFGRGIKFNEKQLEILKMLAMGMQDKTIALQKGISINTVKYHKKCIFKKLSVECSIQAIVKSIKLNLLSVEEIEC